ncbi:two-component system response regulator [Paramagnetospirillum kuznetsovii]|uniref:Two-component system response regulator n=1 Tax=Paramagnetospirillum kuznetsovii TaxID=2053833 RepID=A0A364NUZ6_9PROT|nr:two-component system response regulator [Paramagnetospirillum kuznetsovii]RAU20886.1 two-component system response regulator [Paramagnetospirillum kuznetsovii]
MDQDSGPHPQTSVLIVDDTPQNLTILGELLQPLYQVRVANSGERALRIVGSTPRPDIILLDVMMPGMDGYAVLEQLRSDAKTHDIPVIFITAMNATEDEERGFALGAVDYITKPIVPAIVLARVRTHLELKRSRDRLASQNDWLEQEVARRMGENLLIQDLSVRALACLAEARDNETGHHIIRTQAYVDLLARRLSDHPRFRQALAGTRLGMVVKAAPLHDIGKVGIPDAILLKPGRLTPDEFEVMKTHPAIGAEAIGRAMDQALAQADNKTAAQAGEAFSFLKVAHEISISHHEKWDGSGYPNGLSGDAIPVSARLMALADVFDALICRRVYKLAMSLEDATAIIAEGRGRHFDPDVVDAFMLRRDDFVEIARRHADPEQGE